MKTKFLLAALAASASLLVACDSTSSISPGSGTLRASLTDAPACGYDHVYVTVTQTSINTKTDGSGDWVDINLPTPRKIDLLNLTNGALETLGQTPLAAGSYQQLRLVLLPNVTGATTLNNSVVPTGQTDEIALKTPSAAQTGIKVNTRTPFTVAAGTLVDVVLDFNACKSVVTTGRGNPSNPSAATGYLLKPVVTATPQIVSGAIDGYVDLPNASVVSNSVTTPGALVYAEHDGRIVRGTVADETGHFLLSPLEQSSAVGSYDIVIVNTDRTTDIITAVPVTAQATTTLSTSAVPFTLLPSTTGAVSGTVNVAANATLDAVQTVNGLDYVIANTNADSSTGLYGFTLPVEPPQIAPYSSTLPIVLAAAPTGGAYTIRATSEAGNVATAAVTVTTGSTTTIDFPGLQ